MLDLQFEWLRVGFCQHFNGFAVRGGGCQRVKFPAFCALIFHPSRGWILYDTGYSEHFFQATAHFPECLYQFATPVTLPPAERLLVQLAARGIKPKDIQHIFISHYHGDHIAGLKDFPTAQFWAWQADTRAILNLQGKRLQATLQGQLPNLLPNDFLSRLRLVDHCPQRELPSWLRPFEVGWDIFADDSLLAIPLAGHSQAQFGLFIPSANGRPVFLVADACWSLPALRENRPPPHTILSLLTHSKAFYRTFHQLRQLINREPDLSLLPSHCEAAALEWKHD